MANSIKTNFSAMTALQSLNMTNKSLEKTQSRISTGFRVNEASDNAAYWAIASTLRSDNSALGTVQDSLGLGAGQVDVAYTALKTAKGLAEQIRDKYISAKTEAIDKTLVELDITQLKDQLKTIADGASYSGQNWLVNDTVGDTTAIVSNYARAADGTATIGTITINFDEIKLFGDSGTPAAGEGILGTLFASTSALTTSTSQADLDDYIKIATDSVTAITKAATNLGSVKSRIGLQQDFVKDLKDAIDRGISSLVDADMNEESTRLQALQVQQQLGVQALSIANQSSQSILRLFQ